MCHPPARVEFEREIEALRNGSGFRNLEWYIPYLYSQPGTLADYLPAQNAWLIVEDAGELLASLADLEGQAEQLGRDLKAAGRYSRPWWPRRTSRDLRWPSVSPRVRWSTLGHTHAGPGRRPTATATGGSPAIFSPARALVARCARS